MKNKEFNKFILLLQGVSLHKSEREVMHERILEYTKMKPVRSPIQNHHTKKVLSVKKKRMNIIVSIIVALTAGVGTSFAAEGALPGDTLYPVKVGVNERIRSTVALSNEAEAKLHARFAERRMEEAAQLAVKNRLDAETGARLEAQLENHAQKAERAIDRIEARGNAELSGEIASRIEASLNAHAGILEEIAEKRTELRTEILSLSTKARSRVETVSNVRARTEASASVEANVNLETRAEAQKRASAQAIANARKHIEQNTRLSAEARAEAEARLDAAAEIHALAEAQMEAGEYNEAFILFRQAIRTAHEVSVYANTSARLDLEIGIGRTLPAETLIQNNVQLIRSARPREGVQTEVHIGDGTSTIDVNIPGGASGETLIREQTEVRNETNVEVRTNVNVEANTGGNGTSTQGDAEARSRIDIGVGL